MPGRDDHAQNGDEERERAGTVRLNRPAANQSDRFSRRAARDELFRLAAWWSRRSPDPVHGGFHGEIDNAGIPIGEAGKGIILNSRILWFFSELDRFAPAPVHRTLADRAFSFVAERFDDPSHGGACWELTADGSVANDKKQVYAQCFCIYAFTAYHRLTSDPLASRLALHYFRLLENHARDPVDGGYFEAFSRDWHPLNDVRLGETDLNAPKSMNTHLHLLEAVTALHRWFGTAETEESLRRCLRVFTDHIVDPQTGRLGLFFDARWRPQSTVISFGHDIEASWLLWEAGNALGDANALERLRPVVLRLADNCLEQGMNADGRLCDEFDPATGRRSESSVWWVQAEALVGFLNAFRLTGDRRYRAACDSVWRHVRDHHVDPAGGEWTWYARHDERSPYRAGFWKGPYHNGRAMMEACRLFDALEEG